MTDVVVTIPKGRWDEWISEGDLPGEEWSGAYSFYLCYGPKPGLLERGDRVYVVAHGKLRGYAPLAYVAEWGGIDTGVLEELSGRPGCWALVRKGGAVGVTLREPIPGFRGWRYRGWDRTDEIPFPEWRAP